MKKIPQPSTTERQLIEKLVEKNPNDLSISVGRNNNGRYTPSQIYMVTVQNTENGRRIADGLRKVLRHSGRIIRFRGRHSDRKGLLIHGVHKTIVTFDTFHIKFPNDLTFISVTISERIKDLKKVKITLDFI
jgi:hypothetical protein